MSGRLMMRLTLNLKESEMKRDEILGMAGRLISEDRHNTYGDSATSHGRIAAMWSAYLGSVELTGVDVAAMMVLMKVSRSKGGSDLPHLDNFIDICGYAALAGEMAADGALDVPAEQP